MPLLKRNRAVFRLGYHLELEMVYHELRYVIATIHQLAESSLSKNHPSYLCADVRGFLTEQLRKAKVRGIDGFQFSVCVQLSNRSKTTDLGHC